jgi:TolA-binding protein
LRLASIEQLRSNEIQARIYYLQLIENFPESIYSDFALLSLANSFFSENNNDEALKYYTEILSNYPVQFI